LRYGCGGGGRASVCCCCCGGCGVHHGGDAGVLLCSVTVRRAHRHVARGSCARATPRVRLVRHVSTRLDKLVQTGTRQRCQAPTNANSVVAADGRPARASMQAPCNAPALADQTHVSSRTKWSVWRVLHQPPIPARRLSNTGGAGMHRQPWNPPQMAMCDMSHRCGQVVV
jgi:hypothetical protein